MGKMVITSAGIAEVVNAENTGTAPVTLTHIAFGTGQYTATAERTALQAEFKRFETLSGGGVGDNVLHITMEDDSTDAYSVYEVGVFTESGTLFAVYSQNTPIIQKSAGSIGMLAVDILLDEMNPESVTVGDTNFVVNPATTERKGVIEIATETEAKAGTDTERAITAATLQAVIQNHSNIVHRSGAETIIGQKSFSVSPIAPTPAAGDNSTKIATTAWVTTKAKEYLPLAGGTMTGVINFTVNTEQKIFADEFGDLLLGGTTTGALLRLRGNDSEDNPGGFQIRANNGDNTKYLLGKPDGTLTWGGKNVITSDGGTMTGTIRATMEGIIVGDTDAQSVRISGGTSWDNGASFVAYGKDHASYPGMFRIKADDGTNEYVLLGKPDGTLTWGGNPVTALPSGYDTAVLYVGASREITTLAEAIDYMNRYSTGQNKLWKIYLDPGEYSFPSGVYGARFSVQPTSGSYSTACRITGVTNFNHCHIEFYNMHFGGTTNGTTDISHSFNAGSYVIFNNCTLFGSTTSHFTVQIFRASNAYIANSTFYGATTKKTGTHVCLRVISGSHANLQGTNTFTSPVTSNRYAIQSIFGSDVLSEGTLNITGFSVGVYTEGVAYAKVGTVTFSSTTTQYTPAKNTVGNHNSYIQA